jgi:hypothetical protein
MNNVWTYLVNWLIWLDCGANCLLGGDPQETISSRLGKAASRGSMWAYYACRVLHWFDKQHCQGAIDPHEGDRALWRW